MVTVALAVAVALAAQAAEPKQWHWDDWAAVAIAALLGTFFLLLTGLLQRRHSALSKALADAALQDKIGHIANSSIKTVSGDDEWSLHVARDAVAAMPLFNLATEAERRRLLVTVQDAYGALTLNTFIRGATLPIPVRQRLADDGQALIASLRTAAEDHRNRPLRDDLNDTGDYLTTCLGILEHLHRPTTPAPVLSHHWLQTVYRNDLLVYAEWDADHIDALTVTVETVADITVLDGYHAPWYVHPQPDGLQEVNYANLVEATTILTHAPSDTPVWPQALTHAQVRASGLRANSINRMRHFMTLGNFRSFAVLVYQLADGRRIILDGNHRTAAALRDHSKLHGQGWAAVAFILRESNGSAIPDGLSPIRARSAATGACDTWTGFNPDVALLQESDREFVRQCPTGLS